LSHSIIKKKLESSIILNADVFRGNSEVVNTKIDSELFIKKCLESSLSNCATFSIGWTTSDNIDMCYTWFNMYEAFSFMRKHDLKGDRVTFPIRALWSLKSMYKLIWLHNVTRCSFTIWSYDTEPLTTLESILLFRRMFHDKSILFYDLGEKQDTFLRKMLAVLDDDDEQIGEFLSVSVDELIKFYITTQRFNESKWSKINQDDLSNSDIIDSLVIGKNTGYVSNNELNLKNLNIYGKFELFLLSNNTQLLNSLNKSGVKVSLLSKVAQLSVDLFIDLDGEMRLFLNNKLISESKLDGFDPIYQNSYAFDYLIYDNKQLEVIEFEIKYLSWFNRVIDSKKMNLKLEMNHDKHEIVLYVLEQVLLNENYGLGIDCLEVH
jgi:hypothetical protein